MARNLTDDDIAKKLAFFNIGSEDIARFGALDRMMAKHAPAALNRLYDKISSTPETAGFFGSRQMMRHARDKQIEHWATMFGGSVGRSYFDSAERVGNVHARIGLEPGWYIGAYAGVLERLVENMLSGADSVIRRRKAGAEVATMVKMALLDMEVAISAYFRV